MITALVNGQASNVVDVRDRGLAYGDGIFRTLKIVGGRPIAWPAHWERLQHDCMRMDLNIPEEPVLLEEASRLFPADDDGVLKIIITRGSGGRGYAPPKQTECTRILQRSPAPPTPTELEIGVCDVTLARNSQLAGIKHLNRLEQVLARRECAQAGQQEALMRDSDGWIISGTMSNLFVVEGRALVTPRLSHAGVVGATRQRILAAATRHGKKAVERDVTTAECMAADALFLCNSLMGICPVVRLQNQAFEYSEVTHWCQGQLKMDDK